MLKEHLSHFALFFGMQVILTLLSCFGIKAVMGANYWGAALISTCNSSLVFWGVRKLSRMDVSLYAWFGYTSGSVIGTNLGILLSHSL